MSESQTGTLADLREALAARQAATAAQGGTAASDIADLPKREPKRDAFGRSYATGRRKESVARVWLNRTRSEGT